MRQRWNTVSSWLIDVCSIAVLVVIVAMIIMVIFPP